MKGRDCQEEKRICREFADRSKYASLKKFQPAGLSFKPLDFSPIFGIRYLG
jgi:hypothetical protein